MATASVTYALTNGTTADASQVDTNFDDLVSFLNASVVHADGSVSMSGLLTLHAADPSNANHAVRKSYVDGLVPASTTSWTPTITQSGSVAKTMDYGKSYRIGDWVHAQAYMSISGSGTSGQRIFLSLPENRAHTTKTMVLGTFHLVDTSTGNIFRGNIHGTAGAQTVDFVDANLGEYLGNGSGAATFALASGDALTVSLMYEAA